MATRSAKARGGSRASRARLARLLLPGAAALVCGCSSPAPRQQAAAAEAAPVPPLCEDAHVVARLPGEVDETSGLAASRRHPGILWTHDDSGGEPVVFALDTAGRIVGSVRVTGAQNRDWEDIALGPCAGTGDCLYIADTGDNHQRRDDAAVYRVPEPSPSDAATARAARLPVRFPDHPRDTEALYVLPGPRIFLVSKGRGDPVAVWRVPADARSDRPSTLERVQTLTTGRAELADMVTGADARDGHVVIRSYTALRFYRPAADGRLEATSAPFDLTSLEEPQGEGVTLGENGTVWLSSEEGPWGSQGVLSRLACPVVTAAAAPPTG